jgi:hypothetical protein
MRLHQRKQLKQLVEGAEASRKNDQRIGAHCEMQFANGEIVKLEREIGRRIRVRLLLEGKSDIEADGGCTGIGCAAVRGLHDAGSAPGGDDIVAHPVVGNERSPALGSNAPELARFRIPVCRALSGTRHGAGAQCRGRHAWILTASRQYAGAAEDHDGGANHPRAQPLFRLFVFQLQADPAHGIAQHKVGIQCRKPECGRTSLRCIIVHGVEASDLRTYCDECRLRFQIPPPRWTRAAQVSLLRAAASLDRPTYT